VPGTARQPADSPLHWRQVRRELNQRRHELAQAASRLYPNVPHVGTTPLLCRPEWVPDLPIPLDEVTLGWTKHPAAPAVVGSEKASAHVRPVTNDGTRYPTYADAVAVLDPPSLFENWVAYRFLAANLAADDVLGRLELTSGRYFDSVNISEALAHELAEAWLDGSGTITMLSLPFRDFIGDPCDLERRPAWRRDHHTHYPPHAR